MVPHWGIRGQPRPVGDFQRVLNLWQSLINELLNRYAALPNDRLELAHIEIEEQRGVWQGFWEPVVQTMRQAMLDTGIRGALELCDLIGPESEAAASPQSLPRQRIFQINGQPVTEDDRNRWRKVLAQEGGWREQAQQVGTAFTGVLMTALNPRQARESASEAANRRARARLYQRRDTVERALIEQLGKQAHVLREALRSQVNASAVALARANQEAGRLADRIDPRVPDGHATTSTYYELETGVVSRDYLQHFVQQTSGSVTAGDWQNALNPLINQLLQKLTALSPEQIYDHLNASVSSNKRMLERVRQNIHINDVIKSQYQQEVAAARQRPDNRIHQWLDRLNPYIRWDADR